MKRILVAPLDWGLGHATRCIPVIRALLQQGCEVVIAGSGSSLNVLQAEFPSLQNFQLPAYNPVYPKKGSMAWAMFTQVLKFHRVIREEHQILEGIVRHQQIDAVISDNRYGCWSEQVPTVFITHQSNILMPKRFGWLAPLVRYVNGFFMRKFSVCWIPDYPTSQSLAGELISFGKMKVTMPVEFIGHLTRFNYTGSHEKKFDVVAVFSGPEPQRSVMDEIVTKQLRASGLRYVIVRGIFSNEIPVGKMPEMGEQIEVNFLAGKELQQVVEQASVVIARSGYSTIMDLSIVKSKAVFIPTPGQTEQEYLAQRLKEKRIAYSMPQHEFDLKKILDESQYYSGFSGEEMKNELLPGAVIKLVRSIKPDV